MNESAELSMGEEQQRPNDIPAEQRTPIMKKKTKEKKKEEEDIKTELGFRSIGNALVNSAFQPILSLRRTKINRDSGRQLLSFAIRVGALEIIRRHTQTSCPSLWSVIQSLPLLQLPPFSWLHQWIPFSYILMGSQMFSKPIMFLSIATRITEKLDEMKCTEESPVTQIQTFHEDPPDSDYGAIVPAGAFRDNIESDETTLETLERSPNNLILLKEYLYKSGIILPERIGDNDLERFLIAAKNNVKRCAALIKRNIKWRETFYFLTPNELENWSCLVFWHGYDMQMRPSLVVRIGWAYSILAADQRPRFAQAILSQVEYGMIHLLCEDDPRVTVIIDCEGAPALGFPVNMLKSCCTRVQENYPTRLAALFVVNLPPVVRVIALAIVQVLKPTTKRKIHIEGENYSNALAEHYGGHTSLPKFLGGNCSCSKCNQAMSFPRVAHLQLISGENQHSFNSNNGIDVDASREEDLVSRDLISYNKFNVMLRAIIIGFLMLWVVVSLLAGFFDPDEDYIPT